METSSPGGHHTFHSPEDLAYLCLVKESDLRLCIASFIYLFSNLLACFWLLFIFLFVILFHLTPLTTLLTF